MCFWLLGFTGLVQVIYCVCQPRFLRRGGGQLIFKVVHLAIVMMQDQLHLTNKRERLLFEAAKTLVWLINLPHLV